jgi:hypothetical protein
MHVHRAACLIWLIGLLAKTMALPAGLASMALLGVGVFATMAMYAGSCSNRPTDRREIRKGRWVLRPVAVRRG